MVSDVIARPAGFSADVQAGPQVPGIAEEYELRFARRALRKLKERLGTEAMEKLLQPDIEESLERSKKLMADNVDNDFKPARVQISFKGLKAEQFLHWFHTVCSKNPFLLLDAQPEHYVVTSDENGNQRVLENIGENINRFGITFQPPTHPNVVKDVRGDYPFKMSGFGYNDEGETSGYVLHQFKNTAEGFDADLGIYFPASAPEDMFEQHRQHLVVEFTNWASFAFEHIQAQSRV